MWDKPKRSRTFRAVDCAAPHTQVKAVVSQLEPVDGHVPFDAIMAILSRQLGESARVGVAAGDATTAETAAAAAAKGGQASGSGSGAGLVAVAGSAAESAAASLSAGLEARACAASWHAPSWRLLRVC